MPLILALIKTLSIRKMMVLMRSRWHYLLERYGGIIRTSQYTPYLTIEASNRCMLHCPECATGSNELTRSKGDLSFENFKSIIDEVYPYTLVVNLYMQGEPYLNKSLEQMIAYAKRKNLFVSLSTNAQITPNWKKENLPQHLIVSADGATQANYEKYRVGGQLNKVVAFCHSLAEYKKNNHLKLPFVELQFLVNLYNANEIEACKSLFNGYYNRFTKKSMQIIHPKEGKHFLPENNTCHRYIHTQATTPSCYKMISTTVITQDGYMVPCCMDKDAQFSYGNSQDKSIAVNNQSEENKKFHQLVIKKKDQLSLCKNCPFA